MGWTFAYDPSFGKKQCVAELRSPGRFGDSTKLLQACTVGNQHWYLAQTDGVVWIGLDLLQGGGKTGGWGHKSMSESCGPCYYDCPVSYLDKASAPTGYAAAWREKVRQHHAEKTLKKVAHAPDTKVLYGGHTYQLVRSLGRKGWVVKTQFQNNVRMTSRQLAKATIVEFAK